MADDRHRRACRNPQGDAVNRLARAEVHHDTGQFDLATRDAGIPWIGRRSDGSALLHQIIDAAERGRAALRQIDNPPERDHRPDQHSHVGVEHHEVADADVAGQQSGAAGPEHAQKCEADHRLQGGHKHALSAR